MPKKDTREIVDIDISDDTFLFIAKIAHEQDITFNQTCEHILRCYIDMEMKKK